MHLQFSASYPAVTRHRRVQQPILAWFWDCGIGRCSGRRLCRYCRTICSNLYADIREHNRCSFSAGYNARDYRCWFHGETWCSCPGLPIYLDHRNSFHAYGNYRYVFDAFPWNSSVLFLTLTWCQHPISSSIIRRSSTIVWIRHCLVDGCQDSRPTAERARQMQYYCGESNSPNGIQRGCAHSYLGGILSTIFENSSIVFCFLIMPNDAFRSTAQDKIFSWAFQ